MIRLLLVSAILLLATPVFAQDIYISPDGVDTGNCQSIPTACKRWDYMLPLLNPGETLWVTGTTATTYTSATSGLFTATCGSGGILDGTLENPIVIRSVNERQPLIDGSNIGENDTIEVYNCDYWHFIGLRAKRGDEASTNGWGDVAFFSDTTNLYIYRNLFYQPNSDPDCTSPPTPTGCNVHPMLFGGVSGTTNSVIEENELYDFHRHGFSISSGSTSNVIRRNYANPRTYHSDTNADPCFIVYPGSTNIFENNIAENCGTGMQVEANGTTTGNQLLGNIVIDSDGSILNRIGITIHTREAVALDTVLRNNVIIGQALGVYPRDNTNTQIYNLSVFDTTELEGVLCDDVSSGSASGLPSCFATNSLVLNAFTYGLRQSNQASWTFTRNASSGSGTAAYSPSTPNASIVNPFTDAPTNMGSGACYAYVHDDSNLKNQGSGGGDIGANVLFRYTNGVLTTDPLWDTVTGEFPYGAVIAGINNVAGDSLFDIDDRLNINTVNCPFPDGYADEPTIVDAPPIDNFSYTASADLASQNGGSLWASGSAWTNNGSGTFTIETAPAGMYSGGNAARSTATTGNVNYYRDFDYTETGTFAWVMRSSITSGSIEFKIGNSDSIDSDIYVRLGPSGNIEAWNDASPGYVDVGDYTADTPVLAECEVSSAMPEQFRCRFNKGAFTSWMDMYTPDGLLNRIAISNFSTSANTSWVDTIGARSTLLAFTVQPTTIVSAVAFSPQPAVSIYYPDGTTVNTSATDTVTVAKCADSPAGTLSGTVSGAASSGVFTTASATITHIAGGTGYTLCATATDLTSATSNSFNITGSGPPPVSGTGRPRIRAGIR